MKLAVQVGEKEKHQLEFKWSGFFGVARIWVDGKLVLKSKALAWEELATAAALTRTSNAAKYLATMAAGGGRPDLTQCWVLEIGDAEKHIVRIEKERPLIGAGFRKHAYRIYVDEQLVLTA